MPLGIVLLLHAIQVALFDDVAVFRRKFREHARHALAQAHDRLMFALLGGDVFGHLLGFPGQPVMVHQRVSGDQEQPGTGIVEAAEILALAQRDPEALQHAVRVSCQIKANVVESDENEQGLRAILNYGHTFGHAVETLAGYGVIRHGEAVAIGMVYASRLAYKTGLCDAAVPEQVENLIRSYGLPTNLSALSRKPSVAELMDTMQIDKKAEGGKVNFVLPKKIGETVITKEWDEGVLKEVLGA